MRFVLLFAASTAAYTQPLWFEPNQGQAHASVQFQSRNIYLRATSEPLRFRLIDGNGAREQIATKV
jgi:hypothetical protein